MCVSLDGNRKSQFSGLKKPSFHSGIDWWDWFMGFPRFPWRKSPWNSWSRSHDDKSITWMASFFWFHIASDKKSVQNSPDIHSFSRHDPPTPSIFLVHLFEYVGILEDVGDTRFLHQNHALEFCCLKYVKKSWCFLVFFGVFWCFLVFFGVFFGFFLEIKTSVPLRSQWKRAGSSPPWKQSASPVRTVVGP